MKFEELLGTEPVCGDYALPDGECLKILQPVTETFFGELCRAIEGEGGRLLEENEIGPKCYRTYLAGDALIHLWFNGADCSVRVIRVPASGGRCGYLPLQPEEPKAPTQCQASLAVMALDYSRQNITDANGMSYVLQLEDGSFVIYDGGRLEDADRLFTYLTRMQEKCNPQGKIEIAAWILTHAHGDHYGAFQAFSRMYADQAVVRRILLNAPPAAPEVINPSVHDSFLNEAVYELAARHPQARVIKVFPGQRLKLAGAEIEVLQTYEDVLPMRLDYLNEASVVTRVSIAGQKILFLADAELKADRRLEELGAALKSDFMQVAHHGWSGGTDVLLRNIAPRVLMWTTNSECYTIRTQRNWHNGFNYRLIGFPTVEFSFVADNACKVLKLPFADKKSISYELFQNVARLNSLNV